MRSGAGLGSVRCTGWHHTQPRAPIIAPIIALVTTQRSIRLEPRMNP